MGAVLSQRFGEKAKLYPVAYFSQKLTSAEQDYKIKAQELLAV